MNAQFINMTWREEDVNLHCSCERLMSPTVAEAKEINWIIWKLSGRRHFDTGRLWYRGEKHKPGDYVTRRLCYTVFKVQVSIIWYTTVIVL